MLLLYCNSSLGIGGAELSIRTADELHIVSDTEAIAEYSYVFGCPYSWPPGLMRYRSLSTHQSDWIVEVGNWLAFAKQNGFYDALVNRLQVKTWKNKPGLATLEDVAHTKMHEVLHEVMVSYVFVRNGWTFINPYRTSKAANEQRGLDHDGCLRAPNGVDVFVQTKTPFVGENLNGRAKKFPSIFRKGIKSTKRLDPLVPRIIVISPIDSGFPSSLEPLYIDYYAIGSTTQYPTGEIILHKDRYGLFHNRKEISALVVLNYARSVNVCYYSGTVLLNPWAATKLDKSLFFDMNVLSYDNEAFSWSGGEPYTTIPDGTFVSNKTSEEYWLDNAQRIYDFVEKERANI